MAPIAKWFMESWKDKPEHSILGSRFVYGPDGSYVAFTPYSIRTSAENTLAVGLNSILKPYKDKSPGDLMLVEAALGHGGAWWVQFKDNTCQWDFNGSYKELDQLLNSRTVKPEQINVGSGSGVLSHMGLTVASSISP
jgi:hypothetical protein